MEPILGIDFGTTNSAVAVLRYGKPVTLANEYGDRIIPSAVYIAENGDIYVGRPAKNVAVLHVDSTVLTVKRRLGSGLNHLIHGRIYEPERIASFVMHTLKNIAEEHLRRPVKKAVVTVPAYYDERKRQATKQAAKLAGLDVVRLLNEPTAAALAYGIGKGDSGLLLVYDLGGGTFDVSILQVKGGLFEVRATRGNAHLGGNDFDREMVSLFIGRFKDETGVDLRSDRFAIQKLFEEAEKAKIQLSEREVVDVEIPFIAANEHGPLHLSIQFTRREFEKLIERSVARTLALTKGALKDAGIRPCDVDKLLLVGGSSRIPLVREVLKNLFGKDPAGGVSPEEVVAMGAAVQGGILSRSIRKISFVDVTPLGLGVEVRGNSMITMIPRNSVLPAQAKAIFTTVRDYQKAVTIHVLQGERSRARDNVSLGSFRLEGIRRVLRGRPRIEVCFEIDIEGIVHVSAQDIDTGSSYAMRVDNAFDVSDRELPAIFSNAFESDHPEYKSSKKVLV